MLKGMNSHGGEALAKAVEAAYMQGQTDYHLDRKPTGISKILGNDFESRAKDALSRPWEAISNVGFEVAQFGRNTPVSIEA